MVCRRGHSVSPPNVRFAVAFATRVTAIDSRNPPAGRSVTRSPTCGSAPPLGDAVARDGDPHRRALSGFARDLADAAQQANALAHMQQAEVARLRAGLAPLL